MSGFIGRAVVINHDYKFLLYDGRTWGTTSDSFWVGTPSETRRAVRRLPAADRAAGVYVVTDYGHTSEVWRKVDATGRLAECDAISPPAGVTVV